MKETQEILKQMGFTCSGKHNNLWISDWFGSMLLHEDATPEQLAQFIYQRGRWHEATNSAFGNYFDAVVTELEPNAVVNPTCCIACGEYAATIISTAQGGYCNLCLPPNRN